MMNPKIATIGTVIVCGIAAIVIVVALIWIVVVPVKTVEKEWPSRPHWSESQALSENCKYQFEWYAREICDQSERIQTLEQRIKELEKR